VGWEEPVAAGLLEQIIGFYRAHGAGWGGLSDVADHCCRLFEPPLGLEPRQWSALEILEAFFALGKIEILKEIPSGAQNNSVALFAISLGLCLAEAGLILS
jgi:hypothetical protein